MKRILKGIWFVVFVLCALFVMVLMYSLSSEDGFTSSNRSNIVTESLKEEVKETLRSSPKGYSLAKRIKGYIILYSPYGSNWNLTMRKLAHFLIYFCMAFMIYLSLCMLSLGKGKRIVITLLICFFFACIDEFHQGHIIGRTMSKKDVLIDLSGSSLSVLILSLFKK